MRHFKGQGSMELLVTIGIVLAFTIPVLFLLFSITSIGYESTAKAQADASVRSLADTMNFVYAQGPGAEKVVLLNLPASADSLLAKRSAGSSGGEAVVSIHTSGGAFEAASPTFAVVSTSNKPISKTGLFEVIVKNVNGEVELIEAP